jgi:hypothetical protein
MEKSKFQGDLIEAIHFDIWSTGTCLWLKKMYQWYWYIFKHFFTETSACDLITGACYDFFYPSTTLKKNVMERPFNLRGGYGFFLKKYWFPLLLEKNILILVEFLSYNLMLNSGKKICDLFNKKNKYSNSCVVRKKKCWTKQKTITPPFKLNGRSLTSPCDLISFCTKKNTSELDSWICVSINPTNQEFCTDLVGQVLFKSNIVLYSLWKNNKNKKICLNWY